jgi:DNA-binding transcriptional MerR regulator
MLIGDVARQAGVSRDTVRLYTRLGLVPCQSRPAGSRLYADYDESAVTLVKGIKTAQSIGFTLSELGPIAVAYLAGSLDDSQQRKLLAAKLDQIDDKRRQLDQLSQALHAKLEPPQTLPSAMPSGSELRLATPADLPSIRQVIAAAYDKYLSRMDRPPAPVLRDYTAAIVAGEVWVNGDPVTGLISLSRVDDAMLIENVAVHPSAQGTGLGRRLMEFAEQHAARCGLTRLVLYTNEVMTENQAIYAHLGYHEIRRSSEDGYRRVFMEKILADG